MEFQLPGMNPPPPGPPTSMAPTSEEQSFLGALTSPDHGGLGPPGFPPPGAFHPGFPHGPPGPPMG